MRSENLTKIRIFTLIKKSIFEAKEFSISALSRVESEIDEWCRERRLDKIKIWGATVG